MPVVDGTLTPDDVAAYIRAPVDERMITATNTARAWAQKRRRHTAPYDLWSEADAHEGGCAYAAMRWRTRAAPVGFASYEPQDGADYVEFAVAKELVGEDPQRPAVA